MTHVVLLLLVAGEDADLPDVAVQEAAEDGVAETACAACDKEHLFSKHTHIDIELIFKHSFSIIFMSFSALAS